MLVAVPELKGPQVRLGMVFKHSGEKVRSPRVSGSWAYFRLVPAPDLPGFGSISRKVVSGTVRQHQARRLQRCLMQFCAASRSPKAGWVTPSRGPTPETAGWQGTVQV
jgi:hypothetical protein